MHQSEQWSDVLGKDCEEQSVEVNVQEARAAAPHAFFPSGSALPVPAAPEVASTLLGDTAETSDPTTPAIAAVAYTAERLQQVLERHVLSLPELAHELRPLRCAVANVQAILHGALELLARTTNEVSSEAALTASLASEAAPGDDDTGLSEQLNLYDRYFNVVRAPAMSAEQFTAQVAASCLHVLDDLPYTTLGVDELATIVRATGEMFAVLGSRFFGASSRPGEMAEHVSRRSSAEVSPAAPPTAWSSSLGPATQRTNAVAFDRWLGGHHFFDLCSMFSRDQLATAATALAGANEEVAAQSLRMAALFLRGTTAAMWYASDFPQQTYARVIRPSMVSTRMPNGFSGTQNVDYLRLKGTKERLQEQLKGRYGRDVQRWPPVLGHAFIEFHEIDLTDTEAHTLIIVSKTGLDQSLAQHEGQRDLPPNAPRLNAIALMRAITDDRRQEFDY